MNHRYNQGEKGTGRISQGANKPEGERARGRISQAWSEQARGRTASAKKP